MKQVCILIMLVLLLGCDDSNVTPEPIDDVVEDLDSATGTTDELHSSIVDFGARVFLSLHSDAESPESILISPLSITGALYMALNGAQEETLAEMHQTLAHSNLNISGVNESYASLLSSIMDDNSPESRLNVEHSVFWNPQNFNIDPGFSSRMRDWYEADVYDDKFTVEDINSWADDKTEGRIPVVLKEIRNDEIMFLINALYFLGDWEFPFEEEATRDLPFTLSDGDQVEVSTMQLDFNFPVHITDTYAAVDLPFVGGKYAMSFIRPTEDVDDFLLGLNSSSFATMYTDMLGQFSAERVLLYLPKFEVAFKQELKQILSSLGMTRAFSDSMAQFAGFGQAGGNIFLTRVLHDTFLKIDEKGAEGAAVTTVGVGVESVPPVIQFDKPFLFILRHVDTQIPIFIGTMTDPQ